jgi:hypothetical protein
LINPVWLLSSATTTYTLTVTDGDTRTATATATVTVPNGTAGSWTGTVSTDWFNCANWGNGVVPSSGTDVTIPSGASNVAIIDANSSFASPFSGIASAANVTANNKTLYTNAANTVFNIYGNMSMVGSGALNMNGGGTTNVSGNWDNQTGAAGFVAGNGTVNFNGTAVQTISNNSGVETFYDVNFNNAAGFTLLER